jgi:uncharacterized delta-60 repeat protein
MKPSIALLTRLLVAGVIGCLPLAGRAQIDPTFSAQVDSDIYALIPQPDGKVLAGGAFFLLDGVARNHLGRINSDGALDAGFNPGANGYIYAAVWLTNGQFLLGGNFDTIAGQAHRHIARVNSNGTPDNTFASGIGSGANGNIYAMAVQADGKIIVGGTFTTLNGQARSCLGRYDADGSVDAGFNPSAGGTVFTVALQPDGKILVGGDFQSLGGQSVSNFARLNTNGTRDTNFVVAPSSYVTAAAVQADGKILLGGLFSMMNGQPRDSLARLNADGTLDPNFTASVRPGYQGIASTIALQADGKILVGGRAIGWAGFPYFARFHPDGAVDTNFVAGLNSEVSSIALQRDGKILRAAPGSFARLTNAPAIESLSYSNSSINWQRGGSTPEVWRTTFEYSTNRTNWTFIGAGTRVAGGWQRTGVSAPTNAYIRARGFATAGNFNSSSWFVEAFGGPPVIVNHPSSRTNNAGTAATFTVFADGSPILAYRWRKNGTNLTDTGNVSGATNTTLTLTNVWKADAAAYSVIVSNNFGAITSAVANLTVIDPFVSSFPTNLNVEAGQSASFNVTAAGTSLRYQWIRNGNNMAGGTNSSLLLTNVQGIDGGSLFSVIVSNSFGSVTSPVALLTVNVATTDTPNPAPNYEVYSLAVQPDGKILMGGNFSFVAGQLQVGIARIDSNGNLETTFQPGTDGIVHTLAIQGDGKILLGGGFGHVAGQTRNALARLQPDGRLDTSFNPAPNALIVGVIALPDGKIIVCGNFTNIAGQVCGGVAKLNADGTLADNYSFGANGLISAIAMQSDGKLLVGGDFTTLGGLGRANLGRFNTNGTVDSTFNPGVAGTVGAIAVQADGGIVLGGYFFNVAGQPRSNIARVNTNGVLDATFVPESNGTILTLAVQVDGKIAVGGVFDIIGGQFRTSLARLNPDGTVDPTFNPTTDGGVICLASQPDGKLLAGGTFNTLNGQSRSHFGRLNSTTTPTNQLSSTTTNITWLRSGAGPEVWRTTFDFTTNGTTWSQQDGTRLAGGWRASGLNLPSNVTIRARGFASGSSDGSSWFVETAVGPVAILTQPESRTNIPFTLAQFSVSAFGQEPLFHQWLRNDAPLADGVNLSGTHTPLLNISNTLGSDAALYRVVISNASGSVTSAVATLTVLDPFLAGQPVTRTNNAGTTATFTASAIGTTNLIYQWLKHGTNLADGGKISGAQTAALTMTNVTGSDAGAYQIVITNAWGSVTSSVASLTVIDPLLVTNPVTQFLNRGQPATFGVLVRGEEPLVYQWRKNATNLPLATNATLLLTNVQVADNGSYDVVAANSFGSVTSAVAALTVNIAVPDLANLALNGDVDSMALQPDGKILLGGLFTSVAGQTRNRIARLNADGTLDTTFNPNARGSASAGVFTFAVQTNGQILVGGSFTNVGGLTRSNLARLNSDGSLDPTFNPNPTYFSPGNSRAMTLLLQPDGKIVLGGLFTTVAGLPCGYIGRLHPDGSLDTNFQATADGFVTTLAAQADGRILVGGSFGLLNGQPRSFGRLNADGSLDNSLTNLPNGAVGVIIEQPDGGILIGGNFDQVDGQPRVRLARIAANGSLDSGFTPSADQNVHALAQQADGRILVGGFFGALNGQSRPRLGRLNADGSTDLDFNPVGNGTVLSLITQPDGRILAGGSFTLMSGEAHSRFARLDAGSTVTESLFSDATSVTWLRGGGGPELARTIFETTTNGSNWLTLGAGSRTPGGWRLTGLALPPGAVIRARGLAHSSGLQSSSMWFIETIGGAPLVVTQPASRTNNANTTAAFTASGLGAPPLQFQWLKSGVALADGGNVSGTTTPTLTVSNVFGADAGGYSLVLSNASGVVTSAVAALTVIDPLITMNPASQSANVGQAVTFNVAAIGSATLNYQWRQNGLELAGANSATLTLTNLQATNAGNYTVIITNGFSTGTSSVATLTVNLAVPDAFNPGANGPIYALALQPDGKILVGGQFLTPGMQPRRNLLRLNADGSMDGSFTSNFTNNSVNAVLVQLDGKILVAGAWTDQNRLFPTSLWRVDAAGNLDLAFTDYFTTTVNTLSSSPDGKVWVGGSFVVGKPGITTNLARLKADSSYDSNFTASVNGAVSTLALQSDGKLVIGGAFTTVNGTNRNRLARFNPNGTLDPSFNPNVSSTVNTLAVQPDGKILLGGGFGAIGGTNRARLARLNPDGTLDAGFTTGITSANGIVTTFALQADGKILIGGSFTGVGGQTRNRLARLNPDGSLDTTFNPGANNNINAFAIQPDGAIIVGGGAAGGMLTQIGGQARTNIGRLVNTAPATQSLAFDGTTATWRRGGTSPELWRATFEGSTNGVDWISLGTGTWVTNGWQLDGLSFPRRSMIRARGFVTGGINNGSGWFVQNIAPSAVPPVLTPANGFGFNVLALPGQIVVVEATEDFTFWTVVQTNVVTDLGSFLYAESQAGLFPHRFYRAKLFNGVLPPPAILPDGGPFTFTNGFSFKLAGIAGQAVVTEASTNLVNWTTLATNFIGLDPFQFTDFGSTNLPQRFYRARLR